MAILMVRSACPAAWESGEWGICEADCGQQSSGPATNGQDKFARATFGQDNPAEQKKDNVGSSGETRMGEGATCEANCGQRGHQQRRVICRW